MPIIFGSLSTARWGVLNVIVFDHQREIIRNPERTCNLKACSGYRKVTDHAANSVGAIEGHRSRFEDTVSRGLSPFQHGKKAPAVAPEPL